MITQQNLGSLPKDGNLTRLVLLNYEKNTREVFMSDVIKVCKKHGNLKRTDLRIHTRKNKIYWECVFCKKEHNEKQYSKQRNIKIKQKSIINNYLKEKGIVKICKKHGELQKVHAKLDGKYYKCRLCMYERTRTYEKNNPEKIRLAKNKRYSNNSSKYRKLSIVRKKNITVSQYDQMILDQDNKCAICKRKETRIRKGELKPRPLCIDHDHKTGKLRQLLCWSCNAGLGFFQENIEYFESAISYIRRNS